MKIILISWIFSGILLFGNTISANELPEKFPTSIYEYASITDLGSSDLSFEELRQKEGGLEFSPIASSNSNLGFTRNHFWLKFQLTNSEPKSRTVYLETGRPITDLVTLYQIGPDGDVQEFISGDLITINERPFKHRKIIFPIEMDGGSSYSFYIHYHSDGEVINLPLNLYDTDALVQQAYFEQLIFGGFYGILLLAAVTYLFFYFGIKLRSFLWYTAYVVSIALLHLALDGYFYHYFTPEINWFSQRSIIFFAAISGFALARYTQVFMKVKEIAPILNMLYNVVLLALLGLICLALVWSDGVHYFYPAVNALGLAVIIFAICGIFLSYLRKQSLDPFFSLGILTLTTGFVIFILNNFSVIENSFITENASKLATGLEIIFLSLAMSNKIRKLKTEKEKAQEVALSRSQESNEIKSFFLSNISHELRTPLNAILGLSKSIIQENKDPQVKNDLEVIQYSSLGLLNAIDDILDYSKIEKKELRLEAKVFDLQQAVKDVRDLTEKQAKDKKLAFVYEETNQIPKFIIGDQNRLKQMVYNVLINAVKFTPKGKVRLAVKTIEKDKHSATLIFSIKDTGIGIAKDKRDRIFESFIQEQFDDKRKFGGFGLGLCIVKALTDLHQATLNIESTVGKGTTVTISMDVRLAPQKVKEDINNAEAVKNFEQEEKTFLIVEDNPVNQMVLKAILRKWPKTQIQLANNGLLALEKMKTSKFDLIFMDLQMPEMDGYEATEAIRSNNLGPNSSTIPIIAVTADATDRAKTRVFEVGMDAYITKPIDSDQLMKVTKDCLYLQKIDISSLN